MSEIILEVKQLLKDYGSFRAVDNISFDLKRGQVLGLLGPNGAGKSTTIQILLGITLPTGGSIKYFGRDFAKHYQACLSRINFASAYNSVQGRLTVTENLLVFAGLYGVAHPMQKIAELLDYFESGRLAKHKYWDLSAGERTRVNLVKALLNDPEIILMDEPTASLDPDIADKTLTLIENLQRDRQLSILFTSHNMAEVTRVCDEVIFLDHGTIVKRDTPTNLIKGLKDVEVTLHYQGDEAKLTRLLDTEKLQYSQRENGVVTIKTTHDKAARVIALVTSNGFEVVETEVDKPTLEDVFLQIARKDQP